MRKVIFLNLFTFIVISATAQVQTQVIGDSVFVHSNTSTGELILQNSTDTVHGFLYNTGLGRTAFKRVLIKINDSTYLIGADTLKLKSLDTNFGDTDIVFTNNRAHNLNSYWMMNYNSRYIHLNSDTFHLKTFNDNYSVRLNAFDSVTGVQSDGILLQYIPDSIHFKTKYSDGIDGLDARGGNWVHVMRGGSNLVIERRTTFDSIPLNLTPAGLIYNHTYRFNLIFSNSASQAIKCPFTPIVLDRYTGIYTALSPDSSNFYGHISSSDSRTYGLRYTIYFGFVTRGLSKIIASPDSSSASPANIVWFDKDTMKLGPYPTSGGGGGGTVTNINSGYGLLGGPITTTGTITVDTATLHLKFLGLGDSTIYYPYKSNPKNYLTTANAWGTTGNSGTTGGTNFIGTTDNVPINFRVNNALVGTIGTIANYNVSLGALSLPNTSTGIKNVALGGGALGHDSTGQGNNAIGYTTLYTNTTGDYNTANGWASLGYNKTGSGNTAMGAGSMNTSTGAQTFGNYNTALGFNALTDLFTGNYNIGLGALSGYQKTGVSNTLYVSDSTKHMYYKLDSASGAAPNVIGKDTSGFWHVYSSPLTSSISIANQTANYTLQLTDAGKLITQTNSAASSVTVPPNSSVAFPIGSKIIVNQYGSGQVSIANGSGVVIKSPNATLRTSAQYGTLTLIKVATDTWILNGDLTNTITVYDVDAKKFIDSSGITDSLTKLAINNLVNQLKDSSLWSSFTAIYPMAGGTATTTKWNLKDPRNLDVAYRLTYSGSPTFASTGVLFPTTSDYASTNLTDNALSGGYANNSISYYSRTQNTVNGYDMGCADNLTYGNEFAIYFSFDATNWFGYFATLNPSVTKGLFTLSSTASNVKRYDNGVNTSSKGSAPTTGYTNVPILLGKVAAAATGGKRECAFASIGLGLTDAQARTLYNIVQNFQVTLGRN